MPRALWAKAPFVLLRHRSVLLAVFSASFLVALAAASGPLLRAGAQSEALKGKLQQLSPLAAGLTIQTTPVRDRDVRGGDALRRAAVLRLARSLPYVNDPISTTQTFAAVRGSAGGDGSPADVVAMTRTGALGHVHRLSGDGRGVWVAASVARVAHIHAGGRIGLVEPTLGQTGASTLDLPVGAVYLPLDQDLDNPYWVDFLAQIRPRNVDAPPLPTFLLMSRSELYRTARVVSGGTVSNVFELPIAADSITPGRANEVAERFAEIRGELSRRTPLARGVGCPCRTSSSIEAAVTLASRSVAALTPVITLLAGFAAIIAAGAAFVAGVFNTRRRSAEARLSVVGGESCFAYGLRAVLESILPALAGAAAGFGAATVLARALTPKGTVDSAVLVSAFAATAGGAIVSIAAAALGGIAARGPAIERRQRSRPITRVPWELPVLAAALIAYVFVERGGGLVKDTTIGAHPRLVVLLFPILLAAGVAGVAARGRFGRCCDARQPVARCLPRLATARRGARTVRAADGNGSRCVLGGDVRRGASRVARLEQCREGLRRERRRRPGIDRSWEIRAAQLSVPCDEGRGELRQCPALRRHAYRAAYGRSVIPQAGHALALVGRSAWGAHESSQAPTLGFPPSPSPRRTASMQSCWAEGVCRSTSSRGRRRSRA